MKPYTDLMIDLETFHTHPQGVISQIGWCFFNAADNRQMFTRSWFPDVPEQIDMGRMISLDTLRWWQSQDNFTRQLAAERQSLEEMVNEIDQIWNSAASDNTRVWAKGVSFDIAMWRTFLPELWNFRNVHCLRTLKLTGEMMGMIVHSENEDPHDAVADAVHQAKEVQALCGMIASAG